MLVPYFNIVAETNQNTVVTEYEPVKARSENYESEEALEKEFIRFLCEQGYQYLPIHSEAELIANLRERLEELNKYRSPIQNGNGSLIHALLIRMSI